MSRYPDCKNILIRNKKIQIFTDKHEYTEQFGRINDDLKFIDNFINYCFIILLIPYTYTLLTISTPIQ